MPQYARPIADAYLDEWTEDDGSTDALYAEIDETVPNDADFITTILGPTNAVYVARLSPVEDPNVSRDHVVRYRYAKNAAAGARVDLRVQLRQGYTSEASPGLLIREWVHENIGETWVTQSQTLTAAEADQIGDYGNLFLRFVADQP